jgi:hypothetical protein
LTIPDGHAGVEMASCAAMCNVTFFDATLLAASLTVTETV